METKFKEGDVVLIKSLDWYNKNKDENGDVKVTGYPCSFTKTLSEFCGKCFVVDRVEDVNILLSGLHYFQF